MGKICSETRLINTVFHTLTKLTLSSHPHQINPFIIPSLNKFTRTVTIDRSMVYTESSIGQPQGKHDQKFPSFCMTMSSSSWLETSLASHTIWRGRILSRFNHWVVAKEHTYWARRVWISLVTTIICHGENSLVAVLTRLSLPLQMVLLVRLAWSLSQVCLGLLFDWEEVKSLSLQQSSKYFLSSFMLAIIAKFLSACEATNPAV